MSPPVRPDDTYLCAHPYPVPFYGAWKVTGRPSKPRTVLFRCLRGSPDSSMRPTLRASSPSTASPFMWATGLPTHP